MRKCEVRDSENVFKLIKKYIVSITIATVIVSICYAAISVFLTNVSGLVIDWAIYGNENNLLLLLVLMGISIPFIILAAISERFRNRRVYDAMKDVRNTILGHILHMDLSSESIGRGQTLTGITKDIEYSKKYFQDIFANTSNGLQGATNDIKKQVG